MEPVTDSSSLAWCNDLLPILEGAERPDHLTLGRMLMARLECPQAFVTLVGETSTGKTTLINSLLGMELLPVSAKPTTATVTHVSVRDTAEPRYLAINTDGTMEELSQEQFSSFSLSPDADLLRLCVEPSRTTS